MPNELFSMKQFDGRIIGAIRSLSLFHEIVAKLLEEHSDAAMGELAEHLDVYISDHDALISSIHRLVQDFGDSESSDAEVSGLQTKEGTIL